MPRIARPRYSRAALTTGIVHIGPGNFHRSHQAMYVDRLLNDGGELDWGICGIGLLSGDARVRDALRAQDNLYTLVLRHPDGRMDATVIGALHQYLYGPDDPSAVLAKLVDARTRIASLTITEGGYGFALDDPAIVHDLANPGAPKTVFGYLAEALRIRRAGGTPPFTIMSCDNLEGNGDVARQSLTTFVALSDPGLAEWIAETVAFPSSMVDRITPATGDRERELVEQSFGVIDAVPVVAESFTQWVLEDRFSLGRPAFERAGVQLVDDVRPYELMKLRLLNASHQAMAYIGRLLGYTYVHEATADPLIVRLLRAYMDREATPTLAPVPGVDLVAYKSTLIDRFANPGIEDPLSRLCAFSSDRIPKWLLPVVAENLAHGGQIATSCAIVASWIHYLHGTDDNGHPIDVVDHRAELLTILALQGAAAFISNAEIFGPLAGEAVFVEQVTSALADFQRHGTRRSVERLLA